ncbi:hypothetical protein BH23PLA1_BH23PLA1_00940 [soil metagenome]
MRADFSLRARRIREVQGYSLVELMVVVAIMGIFAAMAAPSFQRALEQSRADAAAADLRSIWVAQRFHKLQYTVHTNDVATLIAEGLIDPDLNDSGRAYAYSIVLDSAYPGSFAVSALRSRGPAIGQGFAIDQDGRLSGEILFRGHWIRPGFQFCEY